MNIKEVGSMNQKLERQLIEVWESSVKATHTFLSEAEIQAIKQYIPEALHHVPHEVYKRSELDEQGNPYPILYMKKVDNK